MDEDKKDLYSQGDIPEQEQPISTKKRKAKPFYDPPSGPERLTPNPVITRHDLDITKKKRGRKAKKPQRTLLDIDNEMLVLTEEAYNLGRQSVKLSYE